ncbi:PIN domain-containing protein [Salinarimonas chemoclinalis]|uniref:PIN domain-containing protein n=1 Tax=Salinarimonas chemoclinalis TaxID=3241599 RepID=UPI0035577515
MKSVFVDTNVLIYPLQTDDPTKAAIATAWIERLAAREALVVSPQIIDEFVSVLTRRYSFLPLLDVLDKARDYSEFCRARMDADTTRAAIDLLLLHRFSWWDSVMLASALDFGCEIVLTEDLQNGRSVDGMLIVDPFAADIDTVLRDI